jgi:hypothetical protein
VILCEYLVISGNVGPASKNFVERKGITPILVKVEYTWANGKVNG